MFASQGWCGCAAIILSALVADPTNIFEPAGTPARSIFSLSMLVRYRSRASNGHGEQEPPQIYGSNQIELSWTVIPILIVVMLFLATTRVIYTTEHAPRPANALDVTVVGHQFWWEYRYPQLGVVTANELHVPVSDHAHPLPTYLTMSSADTDHSFWVPRLAGKMDLIPNKVNTMWIDPQMNGLYLGQCAQYCGVQHAKMLIRVYADSPEEFAAWVEHQRQPAVDDPAVTEGRSVFMHNACISCHTIRGTVATGRFGPDLTHVGGRETIASGSVPNTPTNLREFIDNPANFKPGALMPPMHLDTHDLDAVTAYLTTLK
jgi:cytochrome c oxidase subunit 2